MKKADEELNSNIRCIEMTTPYELNKKHNKLNSNIRCIEIEQII